MQNSLTQPLSTIDQQFHGERKGMPISAEHTSTNQEQQQFMTYGNSPEGMNKIKCLSNGEFTSTSEPENLCKDHEDAPGSNLVFSNAEYVQKQKQSPPYTGIPAKYTCSSSEFSQQLCYTLSNMEEKNSDPKANYVEESAKMNCSCSQTPSTSRSPKEKAPFVASLLESLPLETHVKFYPFKRDPPNPERLTQRLVIADSKAREEKMSQSSHALSPLECKDDGKFCYKIKIACAENKSCSETELQHRLDTNCEDALECSEDYPKSLSNRPSSLVNRPMLSCNDEATTEKCPPTPSSNNLAVQKQNSAAFSPSSTSKLNQNCDNALWLSIQSHRKKTSGGKTQSQIHPPNTIAAMPLLAEANSALKCPPLLFRDHVAVGMLNDCLLYLGNELLCSNQHTTHWKLSLLTKVCKMVGLNLLKAFTIGGWMPSSKCLLFFGRIQARKHQSCSFLVMQSNFQVSIITFTDDCLSETSWKHVSNPRSNVQLNKQLGPALSNREELAEMNLLPVHCSTETIPGKCSAHTAVERTLLTDGKQHTHSNAKNSLSKIMELPNVWDGKRQITSCIRMQVEMRLPLDARCIYNVSDSVHQYVTLTVYEWNDVSAVRERFLEFLTESLKSLNQQTEFDNYSCLDDTTKADQSESDSERNSSDGNHSNNENQYGDQHHNSDDDDDDDDAAANGHNGGGAGDGNNGDDDSDGDDENEDNDEDEEPGHLQQVESDCEDDSESTVPINVTNHDLSNSAYVTHHHHPSSLPVLRSISVVSSSQKTVFTKSDLEKIPKRANLNGQCTGRIQLCRGQPTIPGVLINYLQHLPCENGVCTQPLQVLVSQEEQETEQFHIVGPVQEQSSEEVEFLYQDYLVPTQEPLQVGCERSSVLNCEMFICDGPFEERGEET